MWFTCLYKWLSKDLVLASYYKKWFTNVYTKNLSKWLQMTTKINIDALYLKTL